MYLPEMFVTKISKIIILIDLNNKIIITLTNMNTNSDIDLIENKSTLCIRFE